MYPRRLLVFSHSQLSLVILHINIRILAVTSQKWSGCHPQGRSQSHTYTQQLECWGINRFQWGGPKDYSTLGYHLAFPHWQPQP